MQVKTYTQTHTHRQYWAQKINTPTVAGRCSFLSRVCATKKKERKRNKTREFSEWINFF